MRKLLRRLRALLSRPLRILQLLHLPHQQPKLPLTPRQRARVLVQALSDATLACVREQRHLITQDRKVREQRLSDLATSFIEGDWCPEGLIREDIEAIPEWVIRNIVHYIADGISIAAYESHIWEIYEQLSPSSSLPEVRNSWRGSPTTGRRAGPRRRVPES